MANEHGTPEWYEERKGLYWEEVNKLVDGVVDDIEAGKLKHWANAEQQLLDHAEKSGYQQDVELAVECLRYSKGPSRGLLDSSSSIFVQLYSDPFPWLVLAQAAMKHDCLTVLLERKEYKSLIRRT
jgi:hypothetical protein